MTCLQHIPATPAAPPAILPQLQLQLQLRPQPPTLQALRQMQRAIAGEIEYASWMPDAGAIEYASWTAP